MVSIGCLHLVCVGWVCAALSITAQQHFGAHAAAPRFAWEVAALLCRWQFLAVLYCFQCSVDHPYVPLGSCAHLFCASLQNRGGIYLKHQLSGFLAPVGSTQSIKFWGFFWVFFKIANQEHFFPAIFSLHKSVGLHSVPLIPTGGVGMAEQISSKVWNSFVTLLCYV